MTDESRADREFRRELPSLDAVRAAVRRFGLTDETSPTAPRYERMAQLLALLASWSTVFADSAADVAELPAPQWAKLLVDADADTAYISDDPELSLSLMVRRQQRRAVQIRYGLAAVNAAENDLLLTFAEDLADALLATLRTVELQFRPDAEQEFQDSMEQFTEGLTRIRLGVATLARHAQRIAAEESAPTAVAEDSQ